MIRLLFALAVASFVLSLPLSRTAIGAKLRLVGATCFTLALLPSIVFGLFFSSPTGAADAAGSAGSVGFESTAAGLSCFGLLVLLSLLSFALLSVRKRFRKVKKDPWDIIFSRGGGKQRVKRDDISDAPFDLEGW
ncbi:MAG TPA: hypothetical protein VNM92_05645 [Thermoanaerobaculia bacterium]|nr:hypothetical protein [Thermoanaerobaculia bacterium]